MDRDAILDEVIEYNSPAQLRPDEFTVYQYLQRREERGDVPVSRNTAIRYLNELVEQGVLEVHRVLIGGYWQNAYSAKGEEDG